MPRKRSSGASADAPPVVVDLLDSDDDDVVAADAARERKGQRRSKRLSNNPKPDASVKLFEFPEKEREYVTLTFGDLRRLRPRSMNLIHESTSDELLLNDNLVDFYVKYLSIAHKPDKVPDKVKALMQGLSAEDHSRVHVFNSFFLKRLKTTINQGRDPAALLKWTQGVDLFKKDFIFVPVHEERMAGHWALAIICFPGLVTKQRDRVWLSHVFDTLVEVFNEITDALRKKYNEYERKKKSVLKQSVAKCLVGTTTNVPGPA